MRLCKTIFPALTVFFFWAIATGEYEGKAATLLYSSAAERIKNTVSVLNSKEAISKDMVYEILRSLGDIEENLEMVKAKFYTQDKFLSILHAMLKQKFAQLQQNGTDMERTLNHLLQLVKGLQALQLAEEDVDQINSVTLVAPSNITSESQITNFLAEAMGREDGSFSIAAESDPKPDLKKLLKTGSFVLLMLSTTADVCVFTGLGPCIVLYVVGSGGLLVWFSQILSEMFGAESISIFECVVEQ